jgi:hypothetical protein
MMFRSRWKESLFLLCVCALVIVAPLSFAEESKDSESAKELTHLFGNHVCPITGDPVDPAEFAEYKDEENHVYGRIYTCCGGCVKKAEEKAAELYKKLYLTDAETEKEIEPIDLKNEKCPISGGDVSEAGMIQYNGMVVGHCCDKCPAKFLKDPDTNLTKLVDDKLKEKYELK